MLRKLEISGHHLDYWQVLHIGEEKHKVELPAAPEKPIKVKSAIDGIEHTFKVEDLIINLHEKSEDAYWSRQFVPKYFYHYVPGVTELWAGTTSYDGGLLVSLNDDDTKELIFYFDREIYRRRNGVFMRNGNDLEYLTGDNYTFLQWIKAYGIDDKNLPPWRDPGYEYPEFRKYQRDVFYLIWKVNSDPNILGLFIAKPKKTGITQLFAAYYVNKATLSKTKTMGIMSKGNDASAVNMLFFFHGYDGLPRIFQPTVRDRADIEGSIFFSEPSVKNINTKRGRERIAELQNASPLNTKVYAAKTKAAGFDSPVMSDVWFDELAKYDTENKQDPENVFSRNQETVKLQDFYNGRIWITFYPPETNTRGFYQTKQIYKDSLLSTARNGRTKTGLIYHHITALNSYAGCFDKYGNCNEALASQKNQHERDMVKDNKKAYQAKIRQYSENSKECWSATGAGSTFDNLLLGDRLTDLESDMDAGTRFYIDGRLEWENALWESPTYDQRPMKSFCAVRFVPLTKDQVLSGETGRLRAYNPIIPRDQNNALRYGRDNKRNLLPPPVTTYVGGADPTDYAASVEVIQGSKNASYTMNMPDPLMDQQYQRIASKVIMLEYFNRPDNPLEFYEDLVKEIIWTGKTVIVEANKKWVATKLIEDGLGRYMLVRNRDTGKIERWKPGMNYGLISTETEDLETIVRLIARYITKPVADNDKWNNYLKTINSERLIDQLMSFTKERSKFADLVMGFGLTLMCMEVLIMEGQGEEGDGMHDSDTVTAIWEHFMKTG